MCGMDFQRKKVKVEREGGGFVAALRSKPCDPVQLSDFGSGQAGWVGRQVPPVCTEGGGL